MNFLRHHILIIIISAVLSVGIVAYAVWGMAKSNNLTGISVSRMTLQEDVRGDGNVEAAQAVDLAFERGGKVSGVYAQTGDQVKSGQTIVTLDASDLYAQLAQAEADVKTQQAKLDELKRGSRPEDVENQNISIQGAQTSLEDARRGLYDALQDSYTKADDAVRNKADQMFSNPQADSPQIIFTTPDYQAKAWLEQERIQIELSLKKWKSFVDLLSSDSEFSPYLIDAKENLAQIKLFLEKLSLVINNPNNCLVDNKSACQPISSAWKTDISSARSSINTALSNLTLAEKLLNIANASLATAKQGLVIKEAGTAPEQITAQEAQVDRYKASAQLIRAQLSKSVLKSPIDGVVSRQDANVGTIASSNQAIVSVISDSKFQVKIFVSEADVAKIAIGQLSKVTLDSYGEAEIFDATVIKVDPASTAVNGVDAYKVTLQFVKDDARIKTGMGANVKITTATRENVLTVPASAIIVRGKDKIVFIENSTGGSEEREIEIGIQGSNSYVEIISGLSEGECVAAFGGEQK